MERNHDTQRLDGLNQTTTSTPWMINNSRSILRQWFKQVFANRLFLTVIIILMAFERESLAAIRLFRPTLNTNELVVAYATPQDYGAVGDGITDDTVAFQNAMNAAHNAGGGVIFVPSGKYAFYSNLTIPWGVSLHGDWQDWTTGGGGCVGTTFKVYFGAGQTTNTPFISMNPTAALWGINFWYPNQNPNSITAYPFTIGLSGDVLVQNVVLINSYQGIQAVGADHHMLQTVIGSPLYVGIIGDNIYDVCHINDLHFSPDVWPASLLTNAPAAGDPYATYMRTNGTGLRILRLDGETCMATYISGYKVGIEFNKGVNGSGGCSFYQGSVSNCATALLAQEVSQAAGVPFTWFTLDGDLAISRTSTADDVSLAFDNCTIIGRTGTAANFTGKTWASMVQFQSCTISNTLKTSGAVFNLVNCALSGSQQCNMSSSSTTRATFTGCTFSPNQNIVNNGNAGNLLIDSRPAISQTLPLVYWTNLANQYYSYQPAKTNLFFAGKTYGATGNGTADDTAAIQNVLTTAGNNGGGIVYLVPGKYRTTTTLVVPSGVRLQGTFEGRHWPGAEGAFIWPRGGQGTTNGPPALALSANSGVIGVNFSYETQTTNCIPFPPTIQGRGPNVYAIGILCPNPYIYVDLSTYTCTNHFLDMVDGWALSRGFMVGNGSSGTMMNLGANWTYWINNYGSASNLGSMPGQNAAAYFGRDNLLWFTLGNCTETLVNDFIDPTHNLVYCYDEGGLGPNATCINVQQDGSEQGFIFDAAASASTFNAVNATCCVFADNTDPSPLDRFANIVYIKTTSKYTGTARFFNAANWGDPSQEIIMNGGDVGLDLYYANGSGPSGSQVNAGVLHLVNLGTTVQQPTYNVTWGLNAGASGETNELIGCYTYNGLKLMNAVTNNTAVAHVWNDYSIATRSVFNPNLPVIYGANPSPSSLFQNTNTFSFGVTSPFGIALNKIVVTVDGVVVTNLTFIGSANSWFASFSGLALNTTHTAVITATDANNQVVSTTVSFDNFSPNNYTFEAEDFDYTSGGISGRFIDNPQTNGYSGLSAIAGIDYYNGSSGQGNANYRPQGLETENSGDAIRQPYSTGKQDYEVGYNYGGVGNWGNYTRTLPTGTYLIYMRAASPNGPTTDSASLSLVTSGGGTSVQTTSKLGTFSVPNTGDWQVYTWVPLKDTAGNLVRFTGGSVATLRATVDNGGYNVNFYQLVPIMPVQLATSVAAGSIAFSFPTQNGLSYQVTYKNNLTDPNWNNFGGVISGNGLWKTVSDTPGGTGRFYRVQVQ